MYVHVHVHCMRVMVWLLIVCGGLNPTCMSCAYMEWEKAGIVAIRLLFF